MNAESNSLDSILVTLLSSKTSDRRWTTTFDFTIPCRVDAQSTRCSAYLSIGMDDNRIGRDKVGLFSVMYLKCQLIVLGPDNKRLNTTALVLVPVSLVAKT